MPAYAYPIIINREPQFIDDYRTITINGDNLTLPYLRNFVSDNEVFTIQDDTLCVYGKRLETPEETAIRVKGEEAYMAEYTRRQSIKLKSRP